MSETFDEVVSASWTRFEQRLVDTVRGRPGGCVELDRFPGGDHDVVLATVDWDEEELQARLVGLRAGHDVASLEALGWQPPEDPDASAAWGVVLGVAEVEVLAGMVSGALRYAFGVADPAFVTGEGPSPWRPLPPRSREVERPESEGEPEPTLIGFPEDADDLRRMVEQALEVAYGPELVRDDDGDYPIHGGSVPVWVRVCEHTPLVRLFSFVVRSVRDVRQARIEVDILNRRTPLLKFTLEDGVITATSELLAAPFVGPQLLNTLDRAIGELDDLAADAALRVGGRLWFDGTEDATPGPGSEDSA